MARYAPTTDRGRALSALADELLASVQLPGMLRAALPLVHRELDKTIAAVDAKPEAATAALRPLVARLVVALELDPAELVAEATQAS
jgi:hypothetical protein